MSYHTKKVELFTSIAKALDLKQELLVLKILRNKSDVIQLVVEPRNPNVVIPNKIENAMLNDFTDKMDHISKQIQIRLKEELGDHFCKDFWTKVKEYPKISDDRLFKQKSTELITELKAAGDFQSNILPQ